MGEEKNLAGTAVIKGQIVGQPLGLVLVGGQHQQGMVAAGQQSGQQVGATGADQAEDLTVAAAGADPFDEGANRAVGDFSLGDVGFHGFFLAERCLRSNTKSTGRA